MTESSDQEVAIASLALINSRKLQSNALRTLLVQLRSRNDAATCSAGDVLHAASVSDTEIAASLGTARRLLDRALAGGIRTIPICSDAYPWSLREISDAPPLLYVRGNGWPLKQLPGIAVVGTRKATSHGLTIAERISTYLSDHDWIVVSGLALGIDAAAHEGALKGKTPTVAVLAHGLDRASPRANEPLALRILDHGGVWISEHPPGATARPEFFVQRNRIQVGLSAASVIVEGAIKSGSMTQAEYCLRYRRELFAVAPLPSAAVTMNNELPTMLVSQRGAHPIRTKDDYVQLMEAASRKKRSLEASDDRKTNP